MTQSIDNILEGLISYTQKRHGVIASNIANSDTPGYKAKDLKFDDFLKDGGIPLTLTNEKDMDTPGADLSDYTVQMDRSAPWKDGNNVQIDMEVAKMDENALLYEAGMKMLGTQMSMYQANLKG